MNLYPYLRALLFRFEPETAHRVTFQLLDLAAKTSWCSYARRQVTEDPVEIMGIRFPNRVGLAAGLDKTGAHIDALNCLGFGFVEVGTVTPRPQPGNPRPRLFRLPDAEALINRMGFNNDGLDSFVAHVQARRSQGVVGLNIGKNFDTPIERAVDDYLIGLRGVHPFADYVTINISSPNTKNLRALQAADQFGPLLSALRREKDVLDDRHARKVPLVVKIAPDLTEESVSDISRVLVEEGMDGVIATNTTISRAGVEGLPFADETGGLSGRPVREASTRVIRQLRAELPKGFPIIGVGGIDSGTAALEKIQAGADLVQVYTGFIYRGPALIAEISRALADTSR
ncbi:dihydroorotate dehydrogenase (quinone) [Halothiobacillus diazotrophicus]|uniref:Dihydroorotate dehydrogenase (quinone) n=1 Tax=Halothiobacillus diazotrophicus TaxID=1860122 RepID=A0A191ZF08_9GAMM|nr:quinone-dependent dihydroorotate dehydrogenase [Halothiobacillus diazotrophicus]ANJ66445.1 dihydroorotate dehydrogenase (quinone) [Halothiobacillus diazotrophicus]